MDKALKSLKTALFVLILFLPVGTRIADCFDCTFILGNAAVFAGLIALVSLLVLIFDIAAKAKVESKTGGILMALSCPLALINAFSFMSQDGGALVLLCLLISVACCGYLTVRHSKPLALKVTALVLSAVMLCPLLLISFLSLILGDFGMDTVVQTVESPDGEYYAQLIDHSEGALGGDTLVNVYECGGFDAFVFKIEKQAKEVYRGQWGEFYDMQIYWLDEDSLMINGQEYEIE